MLELTEKWVRDTGLILALVFLFFAYKEYSWGLHLSALTLLALLFYPSLLKPLAYLWLKLTHLLGSVMNKVFFGLVFFFVVTPIALLRRLLGKEHVEHGGESAFVMRSGIMRRESLEKPY